MSDTAIPNPADPYQREAQTFPVLSDVQVGRIVEFGVREPLKQGEVVFRRGDRSVDFFVLLSGSIEIYENEGDNSEDVFTVHGKHQFTGEIDLFNDRAIVVSGRMGEDGEVLRLDRAAFQRMMRTLPDIAEIIMRAFILRRVGLLEHEQGAVIAIGRHGSGPLLHAERFMRRNGVPVRQLTLEENDEALALLAECGLGEGDLPVFKMTGRDPISKPGLMELAAYLGIAVTIDEEETFDTVVVGAGPGGLAAAVYAASEGLKTLVLESMAPGGQAGTSSKIENYLGFPTGVSGQALAGRAVVQAQKFGAVLAVPFEAKRLCCQQTPYRVFLESGEFVKAKTIVVASGASYRGLEVDNLEKYEGQNIHYAATAIEARLCGSTEVVVIGGGNSAGQAAVFLAQHADHVHMLVRGPELAASMSDYLVERIHASPHITLYQNTELCEISGDTMLREAYWRHRETGALTKRQIANIFVMIGASPNTGWLDDCLALDEKGFVMTGKAAEACGVCERPPYAYESSKRGIFAVGDVRADSVKRVASSVGEGSVCIADVHKVLAELYSRERTE